MCGRFLLSLIPAEYAGLLRIDHIPNLGPELFTPRFNIAPTQRIIIARKNNDLGQSNDHGQSDRQLAAVRWGMIPPWAAMDEAFKRPIFNARSETIWEKPLFKDAARTRRCVAPADGFYEWQASKTPRGRKQPYLIQRSDRAPMFFAGIWSTWRPKEQPGAPAIECCAILTTSPNEAMAPIHDRMPVILPDAASVDRWLSPKTMDRAAVIDLLQPCPSSILTMVRIDHVGEHRMADGDPRREPLPLFD